jgi:hypothetical protein
MTTLLICWRQYFHASGCPPRAWGFNLKRNLSAIPILCFFLLSLITTLPVAAEDQEKRVLPASAFSPGWALEGPIKKYTGEDLFEYINGEAELYVQFGFKILTAGLYLKDGNEKLGITADVYEMGSDLEAFGIYANYRKPQAEPIKAGTEGFVGPSQLMFYQGRYFVQLNASGSASQDQAVFQTLAGLISRNLPASPLRPPELDLLKIPALIPKTEKYIPRSVLGYPFFKKGLTAQALLDGRPVRIFVLLEGSIEGARHTAQAYEKVLKEKGVTLKKEPDSSAEILCAQDPLYGGVCLQPLGSYVLGVADLPDPAQGLPLIRQLQNRIH